MAGRVLVVGSVNIDHAVRVRAHPRLGETLRAEGLASSLGGKGANQAVAAARVGAFVGLVAAVGDDGPGEAALEALIASGVDVRFAVKGGGQPTGQAFIQVSATGENTIVVVEGANGVLRPRDLEPAFREPASVLLCQLETPLDTVAAALADVRLGKTRKVLNAAPADSAAQALIPHCDMLVVNETELQTLGGGTPHADRLAEASARLGMRSDQALVVTLGARGAAAFANGETLVAAAWPARVVDTTGAGDCFCGALAARLAEDADLIAALRFANVAAALSVEHAGAQGGLPSRARIEAALAEP